MNLMREKNVFNGVQLNLLNDKKHVKKNLSQMRHYT